MDPDARAPQRYNDFGQPIGDALPDWKAPPVPPHVELTGRYCRLVPLHAARHARDLFEALREDRAGERWTYLFHGPYSDFAPYEEWCTEAQASRDPQFYAVIDAVDGRAAGSAAYCWLISKLMHPHAGSAGCISRRSTTREDPCRHRGHLPVLANAFALGYRRFEWKCDSCNLPSRAAATRFGFTYEGLFRQAIVNKGRNRDTTWFAIIDRDWKRGLQDAYRQWLDPGNFDAAGRQKLRLSDLTVPFVAADSRGIPPSPGPSV
jgi:RimJ/RimL family protein N-acetyltransferase